MRNRSAWGNAIARIASARPAPAICRSPVSSRDDVTITGKTASYASTAESDNINTRHFCPTCGSRVYGENSAYPGLINIAVGCLDDNSWFSPQRIVYAKDRPRWDVTSTDIANFERMPPPS
jgi:hypothetical protein